MRENTAKAEYGAVIPRFAGFNERNDYCDYCPFFEEECDGVNRCLVDDVLELLERGRDLEVTHHADNA